MSRLAPTMERALERALHECAAQVCPDGRAAWSFDLGNGKPLPVTARWEEPWLCLRTPVAGETGPAAPWHLLLLNRALRGAARVVQGDRGGVELQVDLPLHDPELAGERLEAACASFRRTGAAIAGKPDDALDPVPDAGDDSDPGASWVRLGGEHGWQLESREAGRFAVDLDAPGMLSQAYAEGQGGELCLWIEVLKHPALSEQSRRAVGLFVLTLTGRLRMVRGTATESNSQTVRLEVRLPALPTGAELDLALAALSLACRLCTRELRGLSDNLLAGMYLDHTNRKE